MKNLLDQNKTLLLCLAREHCDNFVLDKDNLPLDMFKEIMRQAAMSELAKKTEDFFNCTPNSAKLLLGVNLVRDDFKVLENIVDDIARNLSKDQITEFCDDESLSINTEAGPVSFLALLAGLTKYRPHDEVVHDALIKLFKAGLQLSDEQASELFKKDCKRYHCKYNDMVDFLNALQESGKDIYYGELSSKIQEALQERITYLSELVQDRGFANDIYYSMLLGDQKQLKEAHANKAIKKIENRHFVF